MLDFTSALYLGLRHPTEALRPWTELSTGKPAALAAPAGQAGLARALASLQGCQRATLVPSTLHLFWDLFTLLASDRVAIYMDTGSYAIAEWGVERAAARGVTVRRFPHHDIQTLRRELNHDARSGRQPLVVADGFCPGGSGPAPIAAYLDAAQAYGGLLIVDDTQALGIFGHSPGPDAPYGRGGGGSLRRSSVAGPDVLMVSSLAKGFGVPVAVLAGSDAMVRHFEKNSETRLHCSPPSAAVIHAAEHALAVNKEYGDNLRQRLAQLVSRFRDGLKEIGLAATGGLFPVQALVLPHGADAKTLYERLMKCGVRTVLHRGRHDGRPRISFLINALHKQYDIDCALNILAHLTRNNRAKIKTLEVEHDL